MRLQKNLISFKLVVYVFASSDEVIVVIVLSINSFPYLFSVPVNQNGVPTNNGVTQSIFVHKR